jgi:hypothetical protein
MEIKKIKEELNSIGVRRSVGEIIKEQTIRFMVWILCVGTLLT